MQVISEQNSRWAIENITEIYNEDLNCDEAVNELEVYVKQIKDNVFLRLGFLTTLAKFLLNVESLYDDPSRLERFKIKMHNIICETDRWEEDWISIINVCVNKVYIGNNQTLQSIVAITK